MAIANETEKTAAASSGCNRTRATQHAGGRQPVRHCRSGAEAREICVEPGKPLKALAYLLGVD